MSKPSEEKRREALAKTAMALGQKVDQKTAAAYLSNYNPGEGGKTKYVRYTSGTSDQQRVVQMTNTQVDPIQPPKFQHKKVARGAGSPPPTLERSPTRALTAKDQQDWKVPAFVSNWVNPRGYTVPLHMRLAADGRNIKDTTINHKFAKFAESMKLTADMAKKEIEERNELKQGYNILEAQRNEEKIREEANLVRAEKSKIVASTMSALDKEKQLAGEKRQREDDAQMDAMRDRDRLRLERKREIERQRRLENAGKIETERDDGRDISEKIALGQAQPSSKESVYDQRLFNQDSGLDSGFQANDDYSAYDKPLFADRTAASIYNIKEIAEDDDEEDDPKKKKKKIKTGGERKAPVEFEKRKEADVLDTASGIQ